MASKKINLEEADVTYASANDIRKGGYVILRDKFPCKVVELAKSKPGKHGSAKIKVIGLDIFTAKKYDDIFQSSEQVCIPSVKKHDYQLLYLLDDGFIKLQAADGSSREDLKLPSDPELAEKIEEEYHDGKNLIITTVSALNQEQCDYSNSCNQ